MKPGEWSNPAIQKPWIKLKQLLQIEIVYGYSNFSLTDVLRVKELSKALNILIYYYIIIPLCLPACLPACHLSSFSSYFYSKKLRAVYMVLFLSLQQPCEVG